LIVVADLCFTNYKEMVALGLIVQGFSLPSRNQWFEF